MQKPPYCFLFISFVRFCIYPGVITGYTCVYAPSEEDGSKLTYDKVTKLHLLWQATTADWFPGKITEAGARQQVRTLRSLKSGLRGLFLSLGIWYYLKVMAGKSSGRNFV